LENETNGSLPSGKMENSALAGYAKKTLLALGEFAGFL
jgi:hypothetical protein